MHSYGDWRLLCYVLSERLTPRAILRNVRSTDLDELVPDNEVFAVDLPLFEHGINTSRNVAAERRAYCPLIPGVQVEIHSNPLRSFIP